MTRIHQIVCTKCKTSLNSKAGVPLGVEIACPKCKAKFKVTQPDDADVVDDDFEVVDDVEEETPAPMKRTPPVVAKETTKPKTPIKKPVEDDEDEEEEVKPLAKNAPGKRTMKKK